MEKKDLLEIELVCHRLKLFEYKILMLALMLTQRLMVTL